MTNGSLPSKQILILGIGTGRCGMHSLSVLLDRQIDACVSYQQPPFLPWCPANDDNALRRRFARFRRDRNASVIGDVATYYLPYLEHAIRAEPNVRVVCLKRAVEDVVDSFLQWLDVVQPLPTNHWSQHPATGWHHDPIWTRLFPQYTTENRKEAIRRYWTEYYETAELLAQQYPEQVRVFSMHDVLNTEDGQRAALTFIGIANEQQILLLNSRTKQSQQARRHSRQEIINSTDSSDPGRCAVLVPYTTHIVPDCEKALKELEVMGYCVRRVRGYAAIDHGRNQMATGALIDGFEETMWIDSDVGFQPEYVEQLRNNSEPIVCGIYPKKARRSLACHLMPGTSEITFGEGGGLLEILYAGAGFLLVRREVYSNLQRQLKLPVCNEESGRPTIPFFQPMIRQVDDGQWYLAEDYAFCERARQCGYRVLADTNLRLWHVGEYAYSWEDAGIDRERYSTFKYRLL